MILKDTCSLDKSYDQPRQHIKKQRHYSANKSTSSLSYDVSNSHLWMWEFDHKESWVPKNLCFWTVVLEKTFESPLTARRPNQSILKEISPEYSLEDLMLKLSSNTLSTWCKELTHLKRPLCWERLKAVAEEDDRMSCLVGITVSTDMSLYKLREYVMDREAWRFAVHGISKGRIRLSDWIELILYK